MSGTAKKKDQNTARPGPAPSFEEAMKRLEEVTRSLEEPGLNLEKSVQLYKEGLELARVCRELLETARHEVLVYSQGEVTPLKPDQNGPENQGR